MTASRAGLVGSLILLLSVVTAAYVAGVGDYGPGYDEYLGNLAYGERTFHFLLTGRADLMALDDAAPVDFVSDGHPDLGVDPARMEGPHRQGQGAAIVSALTCQVFFRTLRWLPSIEAHHISNLLFLLPTLAAVFLTLNRLFGLGTAWLSMLFFFAQPRVVGHVFFNTKDTPELCLIVLSILAFWRGWTTRRLGWLIGSAALAGFAASVKINGAFLPLVLLLWVVLTPGLVSGPRLGLVRWLGLGVVGVAAFFVAWPYLLWEPDGVMRYLSFILDQGHTGSLRLSFMPLRQWLVATPEVVQFGLLVGLVGALRETDPKRRAFLALMALAFVVPMARANLPGFRHYDGIRHLLEITMPAAVLATYGWRLCLGWLAERLPRREALGPVVVAVVILIGLIALPWVRGLHPYELAYFNAVSGGLSGAVSRGDRDAGDYWATSYRSGVAWLNENVEAGGTVVVPWAQHLVELTRGSQIGMRDDLVLLDVWSPFGHDREAAFLRYEQALARGPVHVMFITREFGSTRISRHAARYGVRVHTDAAWDGTMVLNILRLEGLP